MSVHATPEVHILLEKSTEPAFSPTCIYKLQCVCDPFAPNDHEMVSIIFTGLENCTPNFPNFPGVQSAPATGNSGLLAIIPSYNFSCNGTITRVSVRASGNTTGGVAILIWRPQGDGTYSLQDNVELTERSEDYEVFFNGSIPVLNGDTIGYRLQGLAEGEDMLFLLDRSNTSRDVTIFSRSTADLPCQVSLCDPNSFDNNQTGIAPFISMNFGKYDNSRSVCRSVGGPVHDDRERDHIIRRIPLPELYLVVCHNNTHRRVDTTSYAAPVPSSSGCVLSQISEGFMALFA